MKTKRKKQPNLSLRKPLAHGSKRTIHHWKDHRMYHHVKKLMYTVEIGEADPRFGKMLLEQFGGANGELAAAMQYSIQGLNCEDAARKDLLMDSFTQDKGSKQALQFLMTREITHMRAFTAALDSMEKPQFAVGIIEPTPSTCGPIL
jgi:Mn-containing catalase